MAPLCWHHVVVCQPPTAQPPTTHLARQARVHLGAGLHVLRPRQLLPYVAQLAAALRGCGRCPERQESGATTICPSSTRQQGTRGAHMRGEAQQQGSTARTRPYTPACRSRSPAGCARQTSPPASQIGGPTSHRAGIPAAAPLLHPTPSSPSAPATPSPSNRHCPRPFSPRLPLLRTVRSPNGQTPHPPFLLPTSASTSRFSRSSMPSTRSASMPAYSAMFFSGRRWGVGQAQKGSRRLRLRDAVYAWDNKRAGPASALGAVRPPTHGHGFHVRTPRRSAQPARPPHLLAQHEGPALDVHHRLLAHVEPQRVHALGGVGRG